MFIILFLMYGCKDEGLGRQIDFFESFNYLNWINSYKIQLLTPKYFNTNSAIDKPVMTWQPIMRFHIYSKFRSSEEIQCLFYKVPFVKQKETSYGQLKVINIEKNQKCSEVTNKNSKNILKGILNFQVFFSNKKIVFEKNSIVLKPLTLGLKFKVTKNNLEEDFFMQFPLTNVKKEQNGPKKRYESAVDVRYNKGISYYYSRNNSDKNNSNQKINIGMIGDSYPDKTLIQCHKVNDKCETVGENSCDRCRFGWFEVIGSKCKVRGHKFCGPNLCGKRGWPACFRGYSYKKQNIESGCYSNNSAGFCENGLKTYCDANKILICL